MHRFILAFASVALVAAFMMPNTADAASRSGRLLKHAPHVASALQTRKVGTYPKAKQNDGKSLWDLGKQNGQWPKLR